MGKKKNLQEKFAESLAENLISIDLFMPQKQRASKEIQFALGSSFWESLKIEWKNSEKIMKTLKRRRTAFVQNANRRAA